MLNRSLQHRRIQEDLRARIFLSDPGARLVFRETELAAEFGLSRTPIRQVLQSLAHEQLVRTQTGVGTIATELLPEHRARDFAVYSNLALAAVEIPGNEITSEIKMRILGLAQMAETEVRQNGNRTLELFVSLAQTSGDATCQIIQEPILSDALAASRWRVIRWRIQDYHADIDAFWDSTLANFARTSSAVMSGDPAHYLRTIAGVVDDMSEG